MKNTNSNSPNKSEGLAGNPNKGEPRFSNKQVQTGLDSPKIDVEGKPMIPPTPNTSGKVTLVTSDTLSSKLAKKKSIHAELPRSSNKDIPETKQVREECVPLNSENIGLSSVSKNSSGNKCKTTPLAPIQIKISEIEKGCGIKNYSKYDSICLKSSLCKECQAKKDTLIECEKIIKEEKIKMIDDDIEFLEKLDKLIDDETNDILERYEDGLIKRRLQALQKLREDIT